MTKNLRQLEARGEKSVCQSTGESSVIQLNDDKQIDLTLVAKAIPNNVHKYKENKDAEFYRFLKTDKHSKFINK